MFDPRWNQLGDILVNYSTRIQAGERLLITMMEADTLPLTVAVYEQAIKAGALPQIQFTSAYLERSLMTFGSADQIDWVPELERYGMEWADAYIGLRGARNPNEFAEVPADRLAAHKRAMGVVSGLRNEHTR